MKSKLLYIVIVITLTLVILLSLTACQNTKNDETENSKNTVSYIGKTTPEELIKTFYDEEVRWSHAEKAIKYFNIEAMVACEILKDYDLEFDDVYNMMFDLDKGDEYIQKHYKDFAKEIEEDGIEFDGFIVKRLKEMKKQKREEAENVINHLIGYPNSEVNTIEIEENYSDVKADNFNIYKTIIKYPEIEATDTELDVWTIEIDGKYYLVAID